MKKQTKGFTLVELLVVIGILGILMGALFPAISSAMLSAQTSAFSMRGRNLFVAITQCNTEREGAGLQAVWPQQDTEGLDNDDKQLIGAPSTTDFFKYLFDTENIDKGRGGGWEPYVDVDIGCLSGAGVPGMSGGNLQKENVAWVAVRNIQSEVEDVIPVFVSRNVDSSSLETALTKCESTDTTKIECGNDKYSTPFGNKAWVLVRKGGAAQVIKAKYSKINVIFNRQSVDNSKLNNPLKFLEL